MSLGSTRGRGDCENYTPAPTPIELRFWWPHDFLRRDPRSHLNFVSFIQAQANRLLIGGLRYGPASKTQKYHKRAELELRAYRKTHNIEHLYNLANYAFLESQAPAFDDAHHDSRADSATRKKFGTGGWMGEHEK